MALSIYSNATDMVLLSNIFNENLWAVVKSNLNTGMIPAVMEKIWSEGSLHDYTLCVIW